jgi:hypothetical protein
MKLIISFSALLLLFVGFSCNKAEPDLVIEPVTQEVNSTKINDQVMILKYRESQKLQGSNWSLTFTGLKEDSRCPADAICIRMGVARVELTLMESEMVLQIFELGLGEDLSATVVYAGYEFKLQQVSPYPMGGEKIPDGYYKAEIAVTRTH